VAGNAFRRSISSNRARALPSKSATLTRGPSDTGDALALADEEKPDLLVDLGTLTGAARVALGPDLPPFTQTMRRWRWTSRVARNRRTIRCGDCRCGRPTIAGSIRKRPISTTRRRAVSPARLLARCPAAFRRGRHTLAACRYLRLDAFGQAGATGGRRMPGRARDLQIAGRTLWMIRA